MYLEKSAIWYKKPTRHGQFYFCVYTMVCSHSWLRAGIPLLGRSRRLQGHGSCSVFPFHPYWIGVWLPQSSSGVWIAFLNWPPKSQVMSSSIMFPDMQRVWLLHASPFWCAWAGVCSLLHILQLGQFFYQEHFIFALINNLFVEQSDHDLPSLCDLPVKIGDDSAREGKNGRHWCQCFAVSKLTGGKGTDTFACKQILTQQCSWKGGCRWVTGETHENNGSQPGCTRNHQRGGKKTHATAPPQIN